MKRRQSKRIKQKQLHPLLVKLLILINRKLIQGAAFLQQKTNGYSITKQKWALLCFCLVFAGLSTMTMIRSFNPGRSNHFTVKQIRLITLPFAQKITKPLVSEQTFSRIHHFYMHLDSLRFTKTGKPVYDSIIARRPHLLDTINYLEEIYYEQLKIRKHA